MTATFLGTFRQNDLRSFFAGLLLVAYLFKAIIPVGYMPDMSAASKNLFSITICTADGPQSINVGKDVPAHDKSKTNFCPFAGATQSFVLALYAPLLVTVFFAELKHFIAPDVSVLKTFRTPTQARAPPTF